MFPELSLKLVQLSQALLRQVSRGRQPVSRALCSCAAECSHNQGSDPGIQHTEAAGLWDEFCNRLGRCRSSAWATACHVSRHHGLLGRALVCAAWENRAERWQHPPCPPSLESMQSQLSGVFELHGHCFNWNMFPGMSIDFVARPTYSK
jgi:hypothetical protein